MNVLRSPLPFPVPSEVQLEVAELSHWSRFQLDFIIAGIDTCGNHISRDDGYSNWETLNLVVWGKRMISFSRVIGFYPLRQKWRSSIPNGFVRRV